MYKLKLKIPFKITIALLALVVVFSIGGSLGYAFFFGGTSVNLQKGLVGYWKLDNNTKDATPYASHLTNTNGVTFTSDRKGQASKAGQFTSASSQYLTVADNTALSMGDVDFMITAWVYKDSSPANDMSIVGKYDATGSQRAYLLAWSTSADRFRFTVSGDGGGVDATAATANVLGAPSNATWYFIVAWHDATANTVNIQVNNGTADSGGHTTGVFDNTAPFRLGEAGSTTPAEFWNGRIDEVRVYKRVLSATERTALYQSYNPGVVVSDLQKGLVGHWDFGAGSTTAATPDKTPNNNDGTVTGATLTTDSKGQSNKAYTFTSNNDSIGFGTGQSTTIASDTFTIYLRANHGAYVSQGSIYNNLVGWGDVGVGNNGMGILIQSTNIATAILRDSSNGTLATFSASATNGTWHDYTMVVTPTTLTIYLDGVAVGSPTSHTTNLTGTNTLYLGRDSSSTRFINMDVSDFRIYNRALSATEVTALYQSYSPGIVVSDLQKGLVGYWDFGAGSTTAATPDKTPYNNDGTVTGATLTTDRKGQTNKAYSFNGTSDLINVSSTYLPNPLANYTVSLWALWNDSGPDTLVFNDRYNAIDANIGIGTTNDFYTTGNFNLKFITRSNVASPTYIDIDSGVVPIVGAWYHIVATTEDISGTSIRMTLYLNGTQVAQSTFASRAITDQSIPNNLELGTIVAPTPDRFFGGKIDDARAYNRALSATEVKALYESYR